MDGGWQGEGSSISRTLPCLQGQNKTIYSQFSLMSDNLGTIRMDGAWLGSVDISMKKVLFLFLFLFRLLLLLLLLPPLQLVPCFLLVSNTSRNVLQAKTAVFFQMDTDIIGSLSQVVNCYYC